MPRPRQPSSSQSSGQLSPFWFTLESALEHFQDPVWLGQQSPLAAPYLLYEQLKPGQTDDKARGLVLRALLRQAANSLTHPDPDYEQRYKTILEKYYFEDYQQKTMLLLLGLHSEAFQRSRRDAITCLETVMIRLLNPALRLEAPGRVEERRLLGRKPLIEECRRALKAGETVMITGGSGVGKTTFASYLAQQWQPERVFWYTVRPGINDQPGSFLFALGYFLHRCGESTLWRELVASAGKLDPEQTIKFVHQALAALKQKRQVALLCFDEIDLLQPTADCDQAYWEHGQLSGLIRTLYGVAPLLMIGQRAPFPAAMAHELEGLRIGETSQMLENADIRLTSAEQQQLHDYTKGNPRLIELLLVLYKRNQPISSLLQTFTHTPKLDDLLARIFQQRLTPMERSILIELSVYPSSAPADCWQDNKRAPAFATLCVYRLIHEDEHGGVALLPAYRDAIYGALSEQQRMTCHIMAKDVNTVRGAYTAAAYHTICAGRPELAILTWKEHQQQEINQGQGGAALRLFRDLMEQSPVLPAEAQAMLALLCAHLQRLQGNLLDALIPLEFVVGGSPILTIEADTLAGAIHNDRSAFGQAEALFRRALETAENLVGARLAHIHKGLGWMYMRERELDAAWREAQLARYEAENLLGVLCEMRYIYPEALAFYQSALQRATEVEYTEGIAKTCINLFNLFVPQGEFEQARIYLQRAQGCYTQLGKVIASYSANISWALLHNLADEHTAALQVLQATADWFKAQHDEIPPWQDALIQQGLAEAHLGLDHFAEAEACIQRAIDLNEEDILPDSYRTRGEIILKYGRLDEAEQWMCKSLDQLEQHPDPYLEGYAWRALARVHKAQGNHAALKQARQTALALFQSINLPYEIEKTKKLLGEIL